MKQEATLAAKPLTEHSMQDRKVLTEDVLKLSKHALDKELKERVRVAGWQLIKATQGMSDLIDGYNDAVGKLAKEFLPHVKATAQESLNALNAMSVSNFFSYARGLFFDKYKDADPMFYSVNILEFGHLIQLNRFDKDIDERITDPKAEVPMNFVSEAGEIVDRCKHLRDMIEHNEGNGYDQTIFYSANMYTHPEDSQDDSDVTWLEEGDRTLAIDCTCSFEISRARTQLADVYPELQKLADELAKAREDYRNLDDVLEDLEMQSTAQRVVDAGGGNLISSIMESVQDILNGKQLETPLLQKSED